MGAADAHIASAGPNREFIRLLRNLVPLGLGKSSLSSSFPSSSSRRFGISPRLLTIEQVATHLPLKVKVDRVSSC
jgi:hypothetical protein